MLITLLHITDGACYKQIINTDTKKSDLSEKPSNLKNIDSINNFGNTVPEHLVTHRGIAYGDGFFTTMGVFQGNVLWLTEHQQRIQSHAHALQLTLEDDQILLEIQSLAYKIHEGMIKVIISRQPQNVRGYGFNNGDMQVLIQAKPMSMPVYEQLMNQQLSKTALNMPPSVAKLALTVPVQNSGTAVLLKQKISCQPSHLQGLKSLNRLENIMLADELAHTQARLQDKYGEKNIVEGLASDVSDMFGQATSWVEGVSSNCFYQLTDNTTDEVYETNHEKLSPWYTPPLDISGVKGVMRQVIINTLRNQGVTVIERRLHTHDLHKIHALFFCNSVKGIVPIHSLYLLTGEKLSFCWNDV